MERILSLILSVIMGFSGWLTVLLSGDFPLSHLDKNFSDSESTDFSADGDFCDSISNNDIQKVSDTAGFVKNQLIVFLKEDVSYKAAKKLAKSVGGKIAGYTALLNQYLFKIPSQDLETLENICNALNTNENVVFATPNVAFQVGNCETIPDDPWYDERYAHQDNKWNEAKPDGLNWWLEAVQAPSAWDYSAHFNHIDLGIVDSGFDCNHEDLLGKIIFPFKALEKDNRSSSHGTHVAGIISANANNGTGITGVCWDSTLHCVDWEPDEKQVWWTGERILSGLGYTVADGAKVVNFSLGLILPDGKNAFPPFLMDLMGKFVSFYMAYLLDRGFDYVVCQAAGNGNENGEAVDAVNNGFFACVTSDNAFTGSFHATKQDVLNRIIIVGNAVNDKKQHFYQSASSNVGKTVSICAPGSSVYSTDIEEKGKYSYKSGTSMATPIVTGICGLVWSIDPSFTGAEVKEIVCDEKNTIYDVAPTSTQIYDDVPYQSYRMVNAKLSVEAAIKRSGQKGTLSAQFIDFKTNQPISADVTVADVQGNTRKYAVPDNGNFHAGLNKGTYDLQVATADGINTIRNVSVHANKLTDLQSLYLNTELNEQTAKMDIEWNGRPNTVFGTVALKKGKTGFKNVLSKNNPDTAFAKMNRNGKSETIAFDFSNSQEVNCYFVNYTNLYAFGWLDSGRKMCTCKAKANLYLPGNEIVQLTVPTDAYGTVWHLFNYSDNHLKIADALGYVL